jgi:hypothetical protein
MDWTWRLDGIVPTVLLAGRVAGILVVLLVWLSGGSWLLARPAARVALQLGLALSVGLALAVSWAAGLSVAAFTIGAALVAAGVVAIASVRRRLGSPARRAAAAAALVIIWDGMHPTSTVEWAALVLFLTPIAGLALASASAALRRWTAARRQLQVALVWLIAFAGVCAFSRFNIWLAKQRAPEVVAACRRFETDRRRLPATLDELVPAYLPRVPLANWTVLGRFVYEPRQGTLSFLDPWPRERVYDFAADRWRWRPLGAAEPAETHRVKGPGRTQPLDA